MRIALCDDQQIQLEQLRGMILNWANKPDDLNIHIFDNGDALLRAHGTIPFDLIFLDVIMPLFNGMEVAREIRQSDKNVKLVFLTTTADFAVDAFSVKASNYLLKPLDPQKLHQCLDDLSQELRSSVRRICVKGPHTLHRISVGDIEYLEAQNKRILFVLSGGHTILSSEPLYAYEEKCTCC